MKKQLNYNRADRIAAKVQTLVAEILRDKYAELGMTLTGAESHGGLQFVRLYYQSNQSSVEMGHPLEKKLKDITPAIRRELSARIDQKYTPDIRFVYDDTLEKSMRIEKLLANL
jgi:ribosome-binding factor A